MSKINRTYYRVRSMHADYIAREQRMLRWLDDRLGAHCYVSWSAGKDSTVVAHAAVSLRPDIAVLMVDPGVPIHWTREDRLRMLECARDWKYQLFSWRKFDNAKALAAPSEPEYRKAVHADQFDALTAHADRLGLTRRMTGMRAAESRTRHVFLSASRGETKHTLQPLWDWSTEDVWTYTIRHGLPWLSIYDHLGPDARNGLIGKNGREYGRLVYLKHYYPEAFRLACDLFGAREYV